MVRNGVAWIVLLMGVIGACAAPTADKPQKPTEETKKKTTTPAKTDGDDEQNDDDENDKNDDENSATEADCKDECPGGTIRCSTESNVAAEVCVQAADGCTRWKHGAECEEGFTCDKAKNDGTCKAGCTNDAGCSAATEGDTRCSSNGTTEETCTKVGACFVFKTTRTNIPQQCTTSTCTGGQRRTCSASKVGACTQHVLQTNVCPANTACQGAGQCVAVCTNACTLNANRCTGSRSRELCVKGASGCTEWKSTQSCSPDETCSNGSCT